MAGDFQNLDDLPLAEGSFIVYCNRCGAQSKEAVVNGTTYTCWNCGNEADVRIPDIDITGAGLPRQTAAYEAGGHALTFDGQAGNGFVLRNRWGPWSAAAEDGES